MTNGNKLNSTCGKYLAVPRKGKNREERNNGNTCIEKYYNRIKGAFTSDAAKEFFNTDILVQYLDEHKEGKTDNSRKIWTVYMFLVWYNDFFGDGYNGSAA